MPLAGLSAISAVTILGNIGWLLHCIFSDPALYPELSADTSPFLLRAPFAGLLMQAMHLMAQPRTTEASDAGARENSLRGRQNSFALLLHIGNLFQIFSDWASPLNPRAHCLVAAPQSFRARSDLSVLSASTPTGDPIHLHLAKWLTQFRGSVVWSRRAKSRCTPSYHGFHGGYPAVHAPSHCDVRTCSRSHLVIVGRFTITLRAHRAVASVPLANAVTTKAMLVNPRLARSRDPRRIYSPSRSTCAVIHYPIPALWVTQARASEALSS
jgi:hypothetical protein